MQADATTDAAEAAAAGQVSPDKAELTALFVSLKAANPEFGQKRLLVAVRCMGPCRQQGRVQ